MRFSVVIPTRNRASLLGHAARSALSQTFDDYEVIISNNASTDSTEEVAAGLAEPRLRYYKVDRALSMVDHWEFALDKAAGEWVLYLCDDDALMPDGLAYLERLLARHPGCQLVQYGHVTYVYGDGIAARGNYIKCRQPTPQGVREEDSRRRLRSVFSSMSGEMPKFLNAAVHRDLIGAIRGRHGRIFHDWAPDYSSGMLLLAHTRAHLVADRPIMVWGKNLKSYGSGSQLSPAHLLLFLREFESFNGTFPFSPYPDLLSVSNGVYDTLYRTRELLGEMKPDLTANARTFRQQLVRDVRIYLEHGHGEYRRHLDRLERDLERPCDALRSWSARTHRKVRRKASKLYAMATGTRTRIKEIRGDEPAAGFQNILEAATFYWKNHLTPHG